VITEVKVWPLKNAHPKIKANAAFVVNNAFKIKCTVFNGPKGLFVGLPGRYGDKVNPETNKKPWYSDVDCITEDARSEMTKAVIEEYNKVAGNAPSSQGEAAGPSDQTDGVPW